MPEPINPFASIDPFALVDAGSDEARAFTTYLGYWNCLSTCIEVTFGKDPFQGLLDDLRRRQAFNRLQSRVVQDLSGEIRGLLTNAWQSELALYMVEDGAIGRLRLANQWAPVYGYYATTRAASAWLACRDGQIPKQHTPLLRALATQVTASSLYPDPWSKACRTLLPTPIYHGFQEPPGRCSSLATVTPERRYDHLAMLLRTTRSRLVTKRVEDYKKERRIKRAPTGERSRQDGLLHPTTTFDFAWRTRTRSNYGHPAVFYMGTLTDEDAIAFAAHIRSWVSATMFLFEALTVQRAQHVVEDSAIHFISRDRSGLAHQIILPRLRVLGLVEKLGIPRRS